MKRRLPLLLLSISGTARFALAATEPVLREFDPEKLEAYKKDSAYRYEERIDFPFTEWMKRIGEMIDRWLKGLLNFDIPGGRATSGDILLWVLAALAVVAIVDIGFKGNWSWLFSGKNYRKPEKEYSVYTEDIHGINFTDEIEAAVQQKNYRKATRLFYLKSLKLLSDAGHIRWQINKTNTDYRREISSRAMRDDFDYLSMAFDYVWYGEFEPTEETFLETFGKFRSFNSRFQQEEPA